MNSSTVPFGRVGSALANDVEPFLVVLDDVLGTAAEIGERMTVGR